MSFEFAASRTGTSGPCPVEHARLSAGLLLWLVLVSLSPPAVGDGLDLRIEIRGLDSELATNVRLYLGIEQKKDSALLSTASLRRLHRQARGEIAEALKPFGYYRPTIEAELVRETDGSWLAAYTIDKGPAIPIETVEFSLGGEMQDDPAFHSLLEQNLPQSGAAFSHLDYEKLKSSLVRLAKERGYFDAVFERQRVEIDLEVYRARVFLDYAGGARYRFGDIEIEPTDLDDDLLRRFASFERGDVYLVDKVIDFQRALNASGYFQTVDVSPGVPDPVSTEVPIVAELVLRKRHRYDFGLGYGTDTRLRVLFGWRMPRINERGHRLNTRLRVSDIGYTAAVRYSIPVLDPRTDELFYRASEGEEEFENGDSTVRAFGVGLNHSRDGWRETLSLEYRREEYPVDDDTNDSDLLIPGVSWTRTWGNNFINVLDGLRFDLSLRGANKDISSDTSFGQLITSLKFITSFGARDRILMRGTYGTIDTDDFAKIPSSIRFFAGGSRSVRGYAYNSLGPTDDDGDAVGAEHLLLGSVEYEHYFDERWGMAVFYDVGNAIDDFDEDLESGAGFGVRWKSLIGPVRIDLANAISDDEDWRLHVDIGPDL
ncbi:MAG: autotransporter assembly complex family protein [Gammaproteobacteria bacterium]|nr:autotransporter assembly complex family protein [Gammaproteobacteria bacterium]